MNLTVDFMLGERVRVPELKIEGRVLAIHCAEKGITYCVRYFDGCKKCEEYFFADELSQNTEAQIGFKP